MICKRTNKLFTTKRKEGERVIRGIKTVSTSKFTEKQLNQQRGLIDSLVSKFRLKSLNELVKTSPSKLGKYGCKKLLENYSNDVEQLFTTLYPKYQFDFSHLNTKNNLKSLENQRVFMDNLFTKFQMKSLDEWLSFSRNKIVVNGGKSLVNIYYAKDMQKLLSTIYPNFPWKFEELKISPTDFFKSLENQQKFMDDLFIKLKLNSMDDWINVSKNQMNIHGGNSLLNYYHYNYQQLLSSIYPNYYFEFELNLNLKSEILFFKSIENQRKFMDELYRDLKLNSLDDWLKISFDQFIKNGAKKLFSKYSNDRKKIFISIYPNYPWKFDHLIYLSKNYFNSIENKRKFMDELFFKLKLKSFDDWLFISRLIYRKNGGKKLLKFYDQDRKKLLSSIYPNFPFQFDKMKIRSSEYFKSFLNQEKFMEKLFLKLKLKKIEDWNTITRSLIIFHGGKNLLKIYNNDVIFLLSSIYPFFPFIKKIKKKKKNEENKKEKKLKKLRKEIDRLFDKFDLKCVNDWLNIGRWKLIRNGARKLLDHFNQDFQLLLSSLYPDHHFEFKKLKYKFHPMNNSNEKSKEKLKKIIFDYKIEKKKDFYRLPIESDHDHHQNLFQLLIRFFPNENWQKTFFTRRSKKSNQRKLFSFLHQIYPNFLILENYIHPSFLILSLFNNNENNLNNNINNNINNEINSINNLNNNNININISNNDNNVNNIYNNKENNNNIENNNNNNINNIIENKIENKEGGGRGGGYKYDHHNHSHMMELDIFIPSLNMAIEYQGEQHYDDIPSGFSYLEIYRSRDQLKSILAKKNEIDLVIIPYWWDHSSSSLLLSLQRHFTFPLPAIKK